MKMTGAKIFVECLKREGVKTIFGIPGGQVIPVFDELYNEKSLRVILTRHEQGATHAAEGYGRVTGKPGVCLVTSGPGATNTVTGIANAFMDSAPLVVFTGQVSTMMIGSDAFQEADIIGITRPITKHSYLVKDVNDLARAIREAFYIAGTGRQGPVLVDFPKDVSTTEIEFDVDAEYKKELNIRGYNPRNKLQINHNQIEKLAQAIRDSKRPLIYVGGGIIASNASKELLELAEKINAPVTTTLMGLGGFPSDHPLWVGMPGMHGTQYANKAFCECDLLFSIGARFDDRVTGRLDGFAPKADKIVHVDIDPASIDKTVKVDIDLVGDAKVIIHELNRIVEAKPRSEWNDEIETWRKEMPLIYKQSSEKVMPQFVIQELDRLTHGKAYVATDVGQHQMWVAQYYGFTRPRTFITSGGLGTMGFGFPAAMGVQVAFPDALVVSVSGDGSFQMNIQELSTVVEWGIPVKVFIINNGYLGMVRQWQELFFNRHYSSTILGRSPDFVKVAEAYGAVGLRITRPEEVAPTIQKALATDGPVVVDCVVESEANVFPMVPAGRTLSETIGGLA